MVMLYLVYNDYYEFSAYMQQTTSVIQHARRKKKKDPRSLGLVRELTLTLKDIEKTSSVGDQPRDPKLPPYGSLYRSIATDH